MKDQRRRMWSRRQFFGAGLMGGLVGACTDRAAMPNRAEAPTNLAPLEDRLNGDNIYTRLLDVHPHLPCHDNYTSMGGSRMPAEVIEAIGEANRYFVDMHELNVAAGNRIAEVIHTEAAMVTCGAFSAMILGAVACLTGTDEEKMEALPHPTWPKVECLIQKAHRFDFDRAYRAAGMTVVEVETREQFRNAVNDKTAMIGVLARLEHARADEPEVMKPHEFLEIGKRAGVPVLIDAASELPPAGNLTRYGEMGADLLVFSGGKGIRGPQSTGILAGRKDLIEAALMQASPNSHLGRGMKVGKEEIIGFIVALNRYERLDHEALEAEWLRKARYIAGELSDVKGLTAEVKMNTRGFAELILDWDEQVIPLSLEEARDKLKNGRPRVVMFENYVPTRCMENGEEVMAARLLKQFFQEESAKVG